MSANASNEHRQRAAALRARASVPASAAATRSLAAAGVIVVTAALTGSASPEQAAQPRFEATPGAGAAPPSDGPAGDAGAEARRRLAHGHDRLAATGRRSVANVALDDEIAGAPEASSSELHAGPMLAVDGDTATAWRGDAGKESWTWTLPFRRIVHLGLVRAHFGDSAGHGVPAAYRLEVRAPIGGRCETWAPWKHLPGGDVDERDGNTFLFGPRDVHAQKQALFADHDACAVRLVITSMDRGAVPVLRELRILESTPSLTRATGVEVEASSSAAGTRPAGVVDGSYEQQWTGAPGASSWTVTIRLPQPRMIDRVRLLLGAAATTADRADGPGRRLVGSLQPVEYRVLTSPDDADARLVPIPEASPPRLDGAALPVRRRLVRFAPRPVKTLRLEITRASGPNGELDGDTVAPVVREIGLYAADDARPVVTEPLFLSVDANPAGLIDRMRGGEEAADARVARDASYRLRRIVRGFDIDSAWPIDASRKRDASAGRFHQVIEGDDPLLRKELLDATSPPPVVMLSGSFDWEFDLTTNAPKRPSGAWSWDPVAPATDPDRGMGLLAEAVRTRAAPFLGFCGGAQILALLDARGPTESPAPLDDVLVRNDNRYLRGQPDDESHHERVWWSDWELTDPNRTKVRFLPFDPLFATGEPGFSRSVTAELPISHGDMLRASAFAAKGPLRELEMVAWSELCGAWIDPMGPEPTWADPKDRGSRCVKVPQAFHGRSTAGYPLIGFQFHPEQRDLQRLAPGSPIEARGDALNVFANSIDLVLDAYVERFWPGALDNSPVS